MPQHDCAMSSVQLWLDSIIVHFDMLLLSCLKGPAWILCLQSIAKL